MSESHRLSLAELEQGRVYGSGSERRTRCPFCGDEKHASDPGKLLAFNVTTGAWKCQSCDAHGLLDEHKTKRADDDPLRPKRRRRPRRSASPPPREPTPAELADAAGKRATLRRMWTAAAPIADPAAVAGAAYLKRRGIPLDVATAARVRYTRTWYGAPAVVFPVQDAAGQLVAAEGRFTDPAKVPKTQSAGAKSQGVFVALPGALDADGVTLCEGPITALSVAAAGFPAVALCGHVVRPWLVRRLALRAVLVSLDWYEAAADVKAAPIFRVLAALGATPYRLAPPDGAGDWNDRLQAVGLPAMRAELDAAICGALARLREA